MKALLFCLFFLSTVPVHAIYEHIGCAGAESPPVQASIHRNDVNHLDCVNYAEEEIWDDEGAGHQQTCSSSYGGGRWGNLECSPSSAGCDVTTLTQCGGKYLTLHAHCPMNQGGPVAGLYGKAAATQTYVQCSYTDTSGDWHTKTCACDNSSGCS